MWVYYVILPPVRYADSALLLIRFTVRFISFFLFFPLVTRHTLSYWTTQKRKQMLPFYRKDRNGRRAGKTTELKTTWPPPAYAMEQTIYYCRFWLSRRHSRILSQRPIFTYQVDKGQRIIFINLYLRRFKTPNTICIGTRMVCNFTPRHFSRPCISVLTDG